MIATSNNDPYIKAITNLAEQQEYIKHLKFLLLIKFGKHHKCIEYDVKETFEVRRHNVCTADGGWQYIDTYKYTFWMIFWNESTGLYWRQLGDEQDTEIAALENALTYEI